MRVIVTCERRFKRTPDGQYWTSSSGSYEFWKRYLDGFDEVCVLSRAEDVERREDGWKCAAGPGVSVAPLPTYIGLRGYLKTWFQVRSAIRGMLRPDDAIIMRIPGTVGTTLHSLIKSSGRPFGVEVTGNPAFGYAPGAISSPLRPLLRQVICSGLREQCFGASASSYVTEYTIQSLFPPSSAAFTTHYSSVDLRADQLARAPRPADVSDRKRIFSSVGTMDTRSKGFLDMVRALKLCLDRGLDFELRLIGGGRERGWIESQARELLGDRVVFLGELPGSEAVVEALCETDIFLFASRNEGLPRVMIEAMSLALPCISTAVSGTVELVPEEDLVPIGDEAALAAKIEEVAGDAHRQERMSARNLEKAREFVDSALEPRRRAMYRSLAETTAAHNGRRA